MFDVFCIYLKKLYSYLIIEYESYFNLCFKYNEKYCICILELELYLIEILEKLYDMPNDLCITIAVTKSFYFKNTVIELYFFCTEGCFQ